MSETGSTAQGRMSLTTIGDRGNTLMADEPANFDNPDLTLGDSRANMPVGEKSMNLDNCIRAIPTVQMPSITLISNGCQVMLFFKQDSNPYVKSEIARLLMTAVLNGKDNQQ